MTWPKCVVIAGVLLGLHGGLFFEFFLPALSDFLFFSLWLFAPLLVLFSLAALFRRRRKLIAIFAVVWVLGVLPLFAFVAPSRWLGSLGFQVQAMLRQGHSPSCRLTEFVENGIKQTVGYCRGFDHGTHIIEVFYDTTGEFILPASQRTPEWKQAMSEVLSPPVVSEEGRTRHMFGNYYSLLMYLNDFQG